MDHKHTPAAQRAREVKARKLAQLAWMQGWGFITGADPEDLRALRLEVRVASASEETWALAHDYLTRAHTAGLAPIQLDPRETP